MMMRKRITALCVLMATVITTISVSSIDVQAGNADGKLNYYAGLMEEFAEYDGYMDECKKWGGYKDFVNKDYDGDKKIDRVKRSYNKNTSDAEYSIEFGNGKTTFISGYYYELNVPFVEGVDLTGDGKKEIIFEVISLGSTSLPNTAASIQVIKLNSRGYYSNIPIDNMTINVGVEQAGKYTVLLTAYSPEISEKLNIGIENWENNPIYGEYDGEAIECPAWDYEIAKSGKKNVMKLYYHLFDKWSPYGMVVTMKYEKGMLHVDEAAKIVIDDKDFERINENYGY